MTEMPQELDEVEDNRPTIETGSLWLKPFLIKDVPEMERLINDKEIAANTRTIDYPYPKGAGLLWISQHPKMWSTGEAAIFAIWQKEPNRLVGAAGLEVSKENHNAELGYWIGREFWGQGICTEAVKGVIEFGFKELGLHKIHAHHVTRNPASGRVMEKAGMTMEGMLKGHVRKWGVFEDVAMYGILQSEFLADVKS